MTTTYKRKYYLMREVKKLGYHIHEDKNERIIKIPHQDQNKVKRNKHIQELRTEHHFGVQTTL